MRDRLLRALGHLVLTRPRTILVVVLLLFAAAAALLPGLRVEAGHSSLVDADDPHQVRFHDFLSRFGSPNMLIALVRGGNEDLRRQLVDRLLRDLPHPEGTKPAACSADQGPRSPGCVRDVQGRIDLAQMKSRALLYLPLKQLRSLVQTLEGEQLGLTQLLKLDSLAALFKAAADELERRTSSAGPLQAKQRQQAKQALAAFDRFIDLMRRQLTGKRAPGKRLEEELLPNALATGSIDARGYFSSPDGAFKLCLIRPLNDSDEPKVVVPFVGYVQRRGDAAARLLARRCTSQPAACPDGPLRVELTGLPAIVADETRTVGRDVAITSLVATLGILALFIFGFRSVRQCVLGLPPLLIGLVLTLAFVRLAFDSLNLVTAAFIATLLGLGIDFAVHLLSRFNELRQAGEPVAEATQQAILGAGPGILTGALTTSGAFVALALNDFRAFSQLGIITGVGLVLVLLTTLTLMPAMLVHPRLQGLQGQARPRKTRNGRFDLPTLVVRRAWIFVLLGLALAGFMLLRGRQVPWSYDYIRLMPQDLVSVQSMKTLSENSDFSAGVVALEASSLAQAEAMARKLSKLATVRRVEAVTSYVPQDQPEKLALLRRLQPAVREARPPDPNAPLDPAALREAVTDLADGLQDARFEAQRGGAEAEAALLDGPLKAVQALAAALRKNPAEQIRSRLQPLQRQVLAGIGEGLALLRANAAAKPITAANLLASMPAGLHDRLAHAGGHFAVYAYPAGPVGQKAFLERFVRQVRSVSSGATGFPITHWESSRAIERGFRDASLAASLALLLLLLIDFRSLRYTLLAVAPLAIGIAWMWGSMGLLGMEYTYVNIIAFPLIIGIGVASGVHILHRYRQEGTGDVAPVVRFTGMAVFLSAATTMVGFGSLALAQHRGAAGLGVLLLIGVGSCLLSATLFLPAVLQLLRRFVPPHN